MRNRSFWPSDEVPRFIRTRYYTSIALSVVPGALLILRSLFDDRGFLFAALPYVLFLLVGALVLWNRRRSRLETERARNGVPVCWECGYDLSATQSPGRCPECGDAFDTESLKTKWNRMTFY